MLLLSVSLLPALPGVDQITAAIDDSQRATLPGQISRRIQSGVDQGAVKPSMQLSYVTLMFKASADHQADLDRLIG